MPPACAWSSATTTGPSASPTVATAEELAYYADEIGIPALDVIRWATKHGAELMGRGHELGTVAEGKLADLVVVDGDPVTDISLLADRDNLLAMVQGGRLVTDRLPDRTGHRR